MHVISSDENSEQSTRSTCSQWAAEMTAFEMLLIVRLFIELAGAAREGGDNLLSSLILSWFADRSSLTCSLKTRSFPRGTLSIGY
ncbi:hypothetical protein PMAYCL1PPCAC_17619 [Pristionchus mayeri]|uniref:Uncharacterized protein n=1 Tax=Pristionchus mayeri TaxID=1317129 RepID=A0AAN5CN94_9BILA|nr:hypothetical protein PMAYCL1PPCAC_17619 [Pristionchus mayeri]